MELTLFEGYEGILKVMTCRSECIDERLWIDNWFLLCIHDHGTDYSRERKVKRKSFGR